jgi:hypothetical protein
MNDNEQTLAQPMARALARELSREEIEQVAGGGTTDPGTIHFDALYDDQTDHWLPY